MSIEGTKEEIIVWGEDEILNFDNTPRGLMRELNKKGSDAKIVIAIDAQDYDDNRFIALARRLKSFNDECNGRFLATVKCTSRQKSLDVNSFQSGVRTEII